MAHVAVIAMNIVLEDIKVRPKLAVCFVKQRFQTVARPVGAFALLTGFVIFNKGPRHIIIDAVIVQASLIDAIPERDRYDIPLFR